ncbi:MAG: hypothetical protein ACKO57_05410 [Alphaproteobacteria bacterium]
MKSFLTLFRLMVVVFMAFSPPAFSQAGVGWGTGQLQAKNITTEVSGVVGDATSASRTISYGIGGLGAVALGALAFFGRFQWGWFFGLVGGLAMIGLYNVAVNNLTGGGDLSNLKISD